MALGKTATFYHNNPGSYAKKKKKDSKDGASPERTKKRVESTAAARKSGLAGKLKKIGKAFHHAKNGGLVLMNAKKNAGKREKSRLKGSKRKKKSNLKSLFKKRG
jgi:hypothetical protein